MHSGTLRKMALALTFWLALHASPLRAQIFTAPLQASTTGTNPVDFEFRADGTLIAKGNLGVGSLLSTDQGTGTRLLWFPSLGAFRVGHAGSTEWDSSNIGEYSAAFGAGTKASGLCSDAFGNGTIASNTGSLAAGSGTTASGDAATALGGQTTAIGTKSTATGTYTTASGYASFAMGHQNSAIGTASLASGFNTWASGTYAASFGTSSSANAYASVAIGRSNADQNEAGGSISGTSWVAIDPVFEVGNGTGSGPTPNTDAFVVYKNGDTAIQGKLSAGGVITAPPGGDIPMFTGN